MSYNVSRQEYRFSWPFAKRDKCFPLSQLAETAYRCPFPEDFKVWKLTYDILDGMKIPEVHRCVRFEVNAARILERSFVQAYQLISIPGNEHLDGSQVVRFYFEPAWGAYLRIFYKMLAEKRLLKKQKYERKKYKRLGPKPSNNKKVRYKPCIPRDSAGIRTTDSKRMTNAEYKRFGLGPWHHTTITYQSGAGVKKTQPLNRAERDDIQRVKAAEKAVAERKSASKEERLLAVKLARDKRNPARIEFQSGKAALIAAGVAGGALTLGISKLCNAIKGVKATADKCFDLFRDIRMRIRGVVKNAMWVVPFIMAVHYVVKRPETKGFFLGAAVCMALSKLLPTKLWALISDFFRYGTENSRSAVETQTEDSNIEFQAGSSVISKLLTTVMCFSIFKDKIKPSTITELMKRVALADRASAGWDTFIGWVTEAIEKILNTIRSMFGKERISLCKQSERPIKEWAIKVDAVTKKINICEGEFDNTVINEVVALYTHGHNIKNLVRGTPHEALVSKYLLHLEHMLQPFSGALNAQYNFRVQPECAIFTGAPGIGKTILTQFICASVLKRSGLLPQDADYNQLISNVWQRNPGKYWNSYAGQHCMIIDDIFQWKGDPTDSENQFMTLIKAVSSWSYPLEFADVASKGKNFFSSKFILGTCNTDSIDEMARNFVHHPEAVVRRIDHPYRLELNPEFKDAEGHLDFAKYSKALHMAKTSGTGIDRFPWHIWRAYKHDFMTGVTAPNAVSLKDVILSISERLRYKLEHHAGDKEAVMDFFNTAGDDSFQEIDLQASKFVKIPLPREYAGGEENFFCFFDESDPEARDKAYNTETAGWWRKFRKQVGSYYADMSILQKIVSTSAFVLILGAEIAIFIALVKGAMHLAKSLFSDAFGMKDKEENIEVQSNVPKTKLKSKKIKNVVVPQSGDMHIMDNVYDNSYKLVIENTDGYLFLGQILFINDKLAACPAHFTNKAIKDHLESGEITGSDKLLFIHVSQPAHNVSMTVDHFLAYKRFSLPDADVDFILVSEMRAHKNIEKYFLTEKQIRYVPGEECRFDVAKIIVHRNRLTTPQHQKQIFDKIEYGEGLHFNGRKLTRYFKYKNPSEYGDCGAILAILNNSSYSGKTVFGFHVAFSAPRGMGYGAILTQEMLTEARSKLNTVNDNFSEDLQSRGVKMQSGNMLPFDEPGSFLPIGILDRPINLVPKTSYYPTKMYGVFGEYDCRPAPLGPVFRDGELCYPMINAVKPYSSPVYVYDTRGFDQIAHVAFSRLTALTNKTTQKRIFTFEESVLGIPELKFRSIPRQTAAGFPYCYTVASGKTEFFGEGQNYDLSGSLALELRERVDYIIAEAKKGNRTAVVFNDFLKDELRSEAKVKAVATRLISSAPLDYVIAWRMYFGDFSAAFMRNNVDSGMAPGICSYTDWGHLADHLSKHGVDVFAGDFKAFDSSEQPGIFSVILDYVNDWYNDSEENKLVRKVLWSDLEHSRHLGGKGNDQRHIYQWNKSLPSGHPFTTIINSMYSLFLLTACYIKITGDWNGFWENVSPITYGDDNVVNINSDVSGVFNQTTVAEAMYANFNVVYTSDDKISELGTVKTLAEVSFLKRKFFLDENYWNCPLELESFLYCTYWCKNKRLEKKICTDELENCLQELSLHPQRVWDEYAPSVYVALQDRKVPDAPCDRRAYLRIVRSRSDDWY